MKFLASLQPSDWIAISSVVVALCALGISIWQGILARHHSHLSAKPIIESNFNPSGEIGLEIYNAGLGPALLTKFTAIYQQEEFDMFRGTEHKRLLDSVVANKNFLSVMSINYRVPSENSVLAPGEVVKIMSVTSDWENALEGLRSSFSGIELKLSFNDIYGKSFSCHHKSGINA